MRIVDDMLPAEKIDLSIPIMMLLVLSMICLICGFCSEIPRALQVESTNQRHIASHTPGYYDYQQFTKLNP